MAMVTPKRFDILLASLEPTVGSEIKKTRPVVVVSPDEMNRNLKTVITVPMTTTKKNYPTRVFIKFQNKPGQVALDQIRTIDKERLIKKLGRVSSKVQTQTLNVLAEMFSK